MLVFECDLDNKLNGACEAFSIRQLVSFLRTDSLLVADAGGLSQSMLLSWLLDCVIGGDVGYLDASVG